MIESNMPDSSNNKKVAKSPANRNNQPPESEDGYEEGSLTSLDNPALNLPRPIINRVNALKNIQLKMVNIETKFYEELHQLECKYSQMFEPLYDQRLKIVNGEYEPTSEEMKWPYEDIFANLESANEAENSVEALTGQLDNAKIEDQDLKGILVIWD